MPTRNTLWGAAIALALVILGAAGVLSNPKPAPAPGGLDMVTSAAAGRAGATVSPTGQR
jgi:hypothetical protein